MVPAPPRPACKVVQDMFMGSRPCRSLIRRASCTRRWRARTMKVVGLGADVAVDFRPRATCAVCLVQEGGAYWAHIGDSRIYQVRDGKRIDAFP